MVLQKCCVSENFRFHWHQNSTLFFSSSMMMFELLQIADPQEWVQAISFQEWWGSICMNLLHNSTRATFDSWIKNQRPSLDISCLGAAESIAEAQAAMMQMGPMCPDLSHPSQLFHTWWKVKNLTSYEQDEHMVLVPVPCPFLAPYRHLGISRYGWDQTAYATTSANRADVLRSFLLLFWLWWPRCKGRILAEVKRW